jgi:capsular polysaccharide biosynthesis protein
MTDEVHFLADISPDFPILQPHHPDKHPSQHSIFKIDKLPPIHSIAGKVVVLAGLTNNIYFHWMLDILPRWELLRINNCNFDEIDYFVVDNSFSFQQETLKLLAIPEHKQININKIHHLQATQLIVPSFPGTVAWMPKWTCDFLKQQFLNLENIKLPSFQKRIYITRKLAKSRRVLNEDEILKLLAAYGFEEIILESMSVLEQAALFSQAEIIISPHGSGLTNLVFCQPGTKVIELFSPNYVYHCYWWISNLVSLDYYYLLGKTLPGWHFHHLIYPKNFSEDIVINIRDLCKLLQIADIK